ncbi:pentapeptide repeat-containing protein [Micromonospora pisi]|uniref:pentapeptide repeat-containing protein n=1 Tax=Micromonospora pisi TaxID=589240 RepID=UPI0011C3906E|nr:pentapeptide repeat-containing protein [Micromonospora pisi]
MNTLVGSGWIPLAGVLAAMCKSLSMGMLRRGAPAAQGDATVRGSLLRQVVGGLVLAVLVAIISTISLWLLLGGPKIATAGTALNAIEVYSGLRISLAVVAGLGAVVALVVAYRRQRYNEAQHLLSQVSDTRDAVRLFGERFQSASGQIGSAEPAVRLAGVYGLLNLANDWKSGRQMCVDVLCGYLRMPFEISPADAELVYSMVYVGKNRAQPIVSADVLVSDNETRREFQVRLAIQRTLVAHLRNPSKKHEYDEEVLEFWPDIRLDLFGAVLCNFDVEGCDVAWADFRRARFLGDAKFWRFTVIHEAKFQWAVFFGGAAFSGAAFGGHANFCDVKFMRKASFLGVKFGVDGEFNRAVFEDEVNFKSTGFGAGAWFPGARFMGAASFKSSQAVDGHHLANAEVEERAGWHDWPSGFEVVSGRIRETT